MRTPSIKLILLAGLVAGTLDILGALTVYSLILHKGSVMLILQRIASAALGQVAFKGGWAMAICGLGFHYIIAFCFTTAYVSLYPYLSFLKKYRLASGLLYGLFVWLVMNRIVLPRTKLLIPHFNGAQPLSPWRCWCFLSDCRLPTSLMLITKEGKLTEDDRQ